MNWENMGTKPDGTRGWEIDHRRPCASFDLNNEDEKYMCFHWTNLQPLWHEDNNSKRDKYDPEIFEYDWKGTELGWVKLELTTEDEEELFAGKDSTEEIVNEVNDEITNMVTKDGVFMT